MELAACSGGIVPMSFRTGNAPVVGTCSTSGCCPSPIGGAKYVGTLSGRGAGDSGVRGAIVGGLGSGRDDGSKVGTCGSNGD